MNGSQKEAGNLLQKEGVPKKEGKKVPSDKGGGSNPGGNYANMFYKVIE